MISLDSNLPLYVDLDGTLLKTDVMLESFLLLVKRNPLYLFLMPIWLLKGRANLKAELAQRVEIPCDLLPYNPELLAFLHDQKSNGRALILISASNDKPVQQIHAHLGLFDHAVGSDRHLNLRSQAKLQHIRKMNSGNGFAYAGNSSADLPIWAQADQIMVVNSNARLLSKLMDRAQSVVQIDDTTSKARKFLEAMRPHQWLKNGLVFLPLLLSHQLDNLALLFQSAIAFISFSLCASSVYFLNDMLDLYSDRQHQTKCQRPFAAGDLSLGYGLLGAPLLLLSAIMIALLLPIEFLQVLLTYWLLTCVYSFSLKRVQLLDAITLSVLYTLRIIAGSAAIGVVTTNWLLGFSVCLFFGLALLKRYTELSNLLAAGKSGVNGRAYTTANLKAMIIAGACSGLLAVVVFAFYINAPDITDLYSSPALLWLICPLLLYLLWRIWSVAQQGKLHEDPILFAATDHRSQLVTLACAFIIWVAI